MTGPHQGFSEERLLASLARLPQPVQYWVGFSGGADSTALLQALHECRDRLPATIHAVHFHHGLQDAAGDWMTHCRDFCRARDIPFRGVRLIIENRPRVSLEEAARDARYRAVADLLQAGELYLTAHQAQDQAETLFLNLMRGSGLEGLAGIPRLRNLGAGWVGRPLLDVERAELEAWLNERGIGWLEDASNTDVSFDRNYLRQELFPLLERRWPGVVRRLVRTARHARHSSGAMAHFIERQSGDTLRDSVRLPVRSLHGMEPEVQALVLRHWLRRNEIPALPEKRIGEFLQQLNEAGSERRAEVRWDGWMIKRYREDLWLHRHQPQLACNETRWLHAGQVTLGPASGTLSLSNEDLRPPYGWTVDSRRAGVRFRIATDAPGRTLKHCFQVAGVPPWLRAGVPVLYWDDEPVAIGDRLTSERLRDWLERHGVELTWRPADPALLRVRDDIRDTRL